MTLRPLPLLVVALLASTLTACSQAVGSSSGNAGFVSGQGIITTLPPRERSAPGPVRGRTIDGERVSLAGLRGEVVVVNVWGSWCAPCRAEAPMLSAAARELAPKGVRFLGIDSRDPGKAAARAFVRRFDVPYDSIYDQQGRTLLSFRGTLNPNAVPSTVVIDRQGRVSSSVIGQISRTTLHDLVEDVA